MSAGKFSDTRRPLLASLILDRELDLAVSTHKSPRQSSDGTCGQSDAPSSEWTNRTTDGASESTLASFLEEVASVKTVCSAGYASEDATSDGARKNGAAKSCGRSTHGGSRYYGPYGASHRSNLLFEATILGVHQTGYFPPRRRLPGSDAPDPDYTLNCEEPLKCAH